jgi:hypothetical protein
MVDTGGEIRGDAIARVDAHEVEATQGGVLLSPQAAFAFGAGAALVLSLFGLWRRRA